MNEATLEAQPEYGTTAIPTPKYEYRPLRLRKVAKADRAVLPQGASIQKADFHFRGGTVTVSPDTLGFVLKGVGRTGILINAQEVTLQLASGWAVDEQLGRLSFSGSFSGRVKVDAPYRDKPANVLQFCQGKGIEADVDRTVELIDEHFSPIQELTYRLSVNMETGREQVIIRFIVGCTLESALAAYDQFIQNWADRLKWETRELIRLSYDIAHL